MILVIRMFALVTLVVSPEVLDRAIVPVVPHGTVTIVDALMEPSSPVEATVVADSEQSQRECDVAAAVRFNVGIILN